MLGSRRQQRLNDDSRRTVGDRHLTPAAVGKPTGDILFLYRSVYRWL